MRAVKSKNTFPELLVRRLLHAKGYRYRLHKADLPGTPDLVFPSREKVLFIHGCFWHGHHCARGSRVPKTNTEYWTHKISRNRVREKAAKRALRAQGWKFLTVWECQLKDIEKLTQRLTRFLD
jgi:DNA mismatch endonuclease (patch repair protein)